jgi:hypothetical protein
VVPVPVILTCVNSPIGVCEEKLTTRQLSLRPIISPACPGCFLLTSTAIVFSTRRRLFFSWMAACSATAILPLLRRMKKTIAAFHVNASGVRRTQHPTSFERIDIEFILTSPDAALADLQKAARLAEESICPVWAMLKGNVDIVPGYQVMASR